MPVSQENAHFMKLAVLLLILPAILSAETINVFGNSSANKSINTNNLPSSYDFGVNLSNLQVYFKDEVTSSSAVKYQVQNAQANPSIDYQLTEGNDSVGIISGNSITYPGVFNYTNITYIIGSHQLTKVITIWNESAPTNFSFKLKFTGTTHRTHSDGAVTIYDSSTGDRLFAIKKPDGYDSGTNSKVVKVYQSIRQAGPNTFLDIFINETNMSNFTYPITIDPTTGVCGTLDNSTHEYILSSNISDIAGTCFTIAANNVTLNGNGNSIGGDRISIDYGVKAESYQNITIKNLIIYNFDSGIMVSGGTGINITSNIAYNNTDGGIVLSQTSNAFVSNNTVHSNSHGFIISSSPNNILISNFAYNNSQYGFVITAVTGINLSNNNATNNLLAQYQVLSGSNATFTGPNSAFQTPSNGLDLNISGSSNVTTLAGLTYNNFTSENLTIFFHNAINISIKFIANNSAGAAKTLCSSPDSYESCNLVNFNGYNNILNITNTSGSATIYLGLYFNASEFNDTNERTTVKIGKYNNGWLEVGRTVYDGTVGSVRFDGITSFSLFGIVAFKTRETTQTASTDTSSSSSSTTVGYSQSENSVEIVADSDGNPVSNVIVRIISQDPYGSHVEQKTTDENGKVSFDLTQKGSYQIEFIRPGHPKPQDIVFDFNPKLKESVSVETNKETIEVAPGPPAKPVSESVKLSPEPVVESFPVVYNLLGSGDAKLGEDYLIKAVKDNTPCSLCEATIKYPSGEETQFKTDAKGDIRIALLFAGQYDISLFDDRGAAVGKKSIIVQADPILQQEITKSEKAEEKLQNKSDPLQLALILAAVSLIAVLIYNIFRK